MMFKKINLATELKKNRNKYKKSKKSELLKSIEELFESEWEREKRINDNIENGSAQKDLLPPENLDPNLIFDIEDIKALCIRYRLRFLNSQFFKGKIPYEAISKIKKLENNAGMQLNEFKILAPAAMFKLEDANKDPLLFTPLSNGKYYLIHKWGNDMAWYNSISAFPFRKLKTLLATIVVFAVALGFITPLNFITSTPSDNYWSGIRILFTLWCMIFTTGIISYFWFAFNHKFSVNAWNSKTFN